jgi:hypothetical protein
MKYLTYRDLPNDPNVKQGFTVETVREGSMVLKQGTIPEMYGFSDTHVKHLWLHINGERVMIIAQTEQPINSKDKYWDIYQKAKAFLDKLKTNQWGKDE